METLLKTLTPQKINERDATKTFPRRVRLSDFGMGVVISIGVTITKPKEYWPLNFNATSYAIAEPPLVHLGHPFKIGNAYGIFGRNEESGYILSGEDRLLGNWESVMIYRPRSKQGKRGLMAFVAGSDELSTNSPVLPIIDSAPGRPLRPAVTLKHGLRISLSGSSIVRCDWEEGLHAMLPSWHGST